jgi:hypothetical protein
MSALSQILDSVPQDVLDGFRDDQPLTVSGLGGSIMTQQELIVVDKRGSTLPEALQPTSATPMELLSVAMSQGADIEKLKVLMDLQERWQANLARQAFDAAMAEFKLESITVLRDKVNSQYGSRYVSLGNLVGTVTPFLSRHGLSASWDIDQTAGIKVSCTVTHKQGGFKTVSMVVPPDKSGAKNPIQEIKSAITYAKGCTFESACGLAASDANVDDDGNSSRERVGMPEDILNERLEWIENCRTLPELQKIFTEAYKLANAAQDKVAMASLIKAKDARKKELQ